MLKTTGYNNIDNNALKGTNTNGHLQQYSLIEQLLLNIITNTVLLITLLYVCLSTIMSELLMEHLHNVPKPLP